MIQHIISTMEIIEIMRGRGVGGGRRIVKGWLIPPESPPHTDYDPVDNHNSGYRPKQVIKITQK